MAKLEQWQQMKRAANARTISAFDQLHAAISAGDALEIDDARRALEAEGYKLHTGPVPAGVNIIKTIDL